MGDFLGVLGAGWYFGPQVHGVFEGPFLGCACGASVCLWYWPLVCRSVRVPLGLCAFWSLVPACVAALVFGRGMRSRFGLLVCAGPEDQSPPSPIFFFITLVTASTAHVDAAAGAGAKPHPCPRKPGSYSPLGRIYPGSLGRRRAAMFKVRPCASCRLDAPLRETGRSGPPGGSLRESGGAPEGLP